MYVNEITVLYMQSIYRKKFEVYDIAVQRQLILLYKGLQLAYCKTKVCLDMSMVWIQIRNKVELAMLDDCKSTWVQIASEVLFNLNKVQIHSENEMQATPLT